MKIALLAPAGAMHRYNGMFHKNLHYAPITLALLAAIAIEALAAEVTIHDETAGPIPLDLEVDVIGITCITGTATRCYRWADYYRGRGIKVILGGVHPSLLPREAACHADSVVVGLGEDTFVRAVRDLMAGCGKPYYVQDPQTTIENRPIPRKDLLDKSRYITLNTVEAIRGCVHQCSFCAYPKAFGSALYKRTIADIIGEIRTLKGRFVVFPDVNLIADVHFAKQLFQALVPLKKWWFGLTTSAIGKDEELLEIFEASGCKGLLIGFESVNQATQKNLLKGVNQVADYKELMDRLHRHGIMVMGCFAFGSDEDELDVFRRTLEMCVEVKLDLPRFAVITPFPGTALYEELEQEGRITARDWALYDVEHVVFRPRQMTRQELEAGIGRAWREAYSVQNIWRRFDLKNIRKLWAQSFIYFALNLGYRKYAKGFAIFDEKTMTDNEDIPVGAPPRPLSEEPV